MNPPRLTHVRVNVRNLAEAIRWYEDLLAVPASGHWPDDRPTYAHFELGPVRFAIAEFTPAPTGARFNFEVDDVDGWWARLTEQTDIVEPLFSTPYGTRKFTIRDPDGNELGFVQA
ncbi:VOC family protein [Microlunatus parietis]|uniref:Catechol 2,3-dioxygenase-like lactoylglutathione lyase family enzyme n=1 Tax=Microlunatus parietis TaxID=682979 RepID=A0A7Y9LCV5_9ACTN|nr:VOC family protein [Microlunatus parietis]NYE75239.1 catechol 2,3-dioxygenase-like lactoylglutathione lyase family enzyme [Microlunatus parietis]